jgi:hypothetical protein
MQKKKIYFNLLKMENVNVLISYLIKNLKKIVIKSKNKNKY